MASLKKYRIMYKDGRTQELDAHTTQVNGEFVRFEVDGEWVHHVAADSVESVGLADIPAPRKSAPRTGAV